MAERNVLQAQQERDEHRRRVVGFIVADEIKELDGLKKRDRSATPNLQDYVPGSYSNEGALAGECDKGPTASVQQKITSLR